MNENHTLDHLLTLVERCNSNQLYWFRSYQLWGDILCNNCEIDSIKRLCSLMNPVHIPDCCGFLERMIFQDYKKPLFEDIF